MANPIAVPGTNVPSGAAVSPGGAQGPTTVSANANNKATLGSDLLLLVQGTAAGVAATTHAQTVSGDDPQLTNARTPTAHHTTHEHGGGDAVNITYSDLLAIPATFAPTPHEASHVTGTDQIPLASASTKGLLKQTSGNTTDFIDGTNNSQPLQPVIWSARLRSFNALGQSNPTFEVDQRFCGATSSNANGFVQDRWTNTRAGTMTFNSGQMGPAQVLAPGTAFAVSRSFHRITLTTAQASLAAAHAHQLNTVVEGSQWRELQYDYHSIQLLVRSSVAPLKFGVFLSDSPATKSLTKLCTISTANVWTLITLPNLAVFPGGNFTTTPGAVGYVFGISLGCGSTYTAPANDTWQNGYFLAALGQDNWFANAVNSTFDVGFVQHEPGSLCTGLLDLPFSQNLDDCTLYYAKAAPYGTLACQGNAYHLLGPTLNGNTIVRSALRFARRMATAPTIRVSGTTATLNQVYIEGIGNSAIASISATDSGIQMVTLSANATLAGASVLGDWDADTSW
jgi:hypothetical protein